MDILFSSAAMNIEIRSRKFYELQVGLAYMAIGFLGWSLAYFVPNLDNMMPLCLFRSMTGIPCPACGATHSGILLSRFYWVEAMSANPLFFSLYMALVIWGFNSVIGLVFGRNLFLNFSLLEKAWIRRGMIGIILINWIFMIIRALAIKTTLLY
jgi:hypothetical protein